MAFLVTSESLEIFYAFVFKRCLNARILPIPAAQEHGMTTSDLRRKDKAGQNTLCRSKAKSGAAWTYPTHPN